jgi:hypothetical protein
MARTRQKNKKVYQIQKIGRTFLDMRIPARFFCLVIIQLGTELQQLPVIVPFIVFHVPAEQTTPQFFPPKKVSEFIDRK